MISNCPLCQEKELRLALCGLKDWEYEVKGTFNFYVCDNCELLILLPQPTQEQLKTYYPNNYHAFHVQEKGIIAYLYRVVYFFRFKEYNYLIGEKGRILDVGCSDASYFDLLNRQFSQFQLMGIEFKDEVAARGRAKGRNIFTGTLTDFEDKEKFDLIIMDNLIEHVLNPLDELRKAYSLLRPRGYVILETPNFDSWDFALMRKFWGGIHSPRHIHIFSSSSIKILASKAGFKVCREEFLLNTDHWALSIQNYLQDKAEFKVKLKNGRAWYYKYLLLIFIPLNILQVLFRKTGSVKIILKK